MVIEYIILSVLINGLFGLELEQIPDEPLIEGDTLSLVCSGKAWKKNGGSCKIKQVGNPRKVFSITWYDGRGYKNDYGPNIDKATRIRFKLGIKVPGKSSKCVIKIIKLALDDAGEWSCDIFTPQDNDTKTGTFNLTDIEPLPTTQPATTTENLSIETEQSTETELSIEQELPMETQLESISIGTIIGISITILILMVITIVILAYYDIIKFFSCLPRKSPGLRQVDEIARKNSLRRRARRSMHTFLDYVEKQSNRKSIFT